MIKAGKLRLLPTKEQELLFFSFCNISRFAYNESLSFKISMYNDGIFVGVQECIDHIKDLKYSEEYSWIKLAPEAVTKQAIRDMNRSFTLFFKRGNKGFPKYKKKFKTRPSFYQRTDRFYQIDEKHVRITGIKQPVKCIKTQLPNKIVNTRVIYDGKYWFLTYSYYYEAEIVELTDEAVLSGYGNPVGETNNQLAMAIASKVDQDAMDALQTASVAFTANANISYNGIVDAIDLFQEEDNVEKVMFIHPSQVSELRKDANFISKDKYGNEVMVNGEIGMVANARIVPSKRVPLAEGVYSCPIVELKPEEQTGDETAAITIYMKRGVNLETERHLNNYTTLIGADEHYVAALTDESKVVLAKFTA